MNDHARGGRVLSLGAAPAKPAPSPTRPIAALRAADGTRGAHCAGLAEPLRAMRIVYMSGWIARRWEDPSFPQAFPNFRDHRYWMEEYEALVGISEGLA